MLYGGHYYYCYSCGRQQTRPTCDPDTCSCDEGSTCDPVDPNSMTMTVPAVSGSATIMLNPREWSYETSYLQSEVAFNFSKAFAADLSASVGVAPSGLPVVQPDTVAVTNIRNITAPVASLDQALDQLSTSQQKSVALRDSTPLWITIDFMILVIDLEGTGTSTTPTTMIQTMQSNCASPTLAAGGHVAFNGYLLWGCLTGLTETTYTLQSQLGEDAGDAGVITIGWTHIFALLLSCIGCCYCCTKGLELKDQRRYTRQRNARRAEAERQAEADAASMPPTVDAVSVVSAMPVAEQPTPMVTAVAAVVSGAQATATPVAAEAAIDGTMSFETEQSSIPRQRSEPPSWGEMLAQPSAEDEVPTVGLPVRPPPHTATDLP